MLLAFVFLARMFWRYRTSLTIELDALDIVLLAGCCILYIAGVYMCPVIYKTLLQITTKTKLPYLKVSYLYCRSNVLKYLPGNVMQYVGRNQIAIDEGLSHAEVGLATLLEIGIVAMSAVSVAAVFSWSYLVEAVRQFVKINYWVVGIGILGAAVILIAVFLLFSKKIISYLSGILNVQNILKILLLIIYYAFVLIINAVVYFCVLSILKSSVPPEYYLVGTGLHSLAFFLGYVTLGAPGGLGIREAVLVYFFSAFMAENQVLAGALVTRIISVAGDFFAWAGMFLLNKLTKDKKEKQSDAENKEKA